MTQQEFENEIAESITDKLSNIAVTAMLGRVEVLISFGIVRGIDGCARIATILHEPTKDLFDKDYIEAFQLHLGESLGQIID